MQQVEVSGVRSSGSESALVRITGAASVTMDGCSVAGSPSCGVLVANGGTFHAHKSVISNNTSDNLTVYGPHSRAVLQDGCKLLDSREGWGALVRDGGSLEATGADISGNGYGNLSARGRGSSVRLIDCRLTAAPSGPNPGAFIHSGAQLDAKGCSFSGNGGLGLLVCGCVSTATLEGCETVANSDIGVACSKGAQITAANTTIKGNSLGPRADLPDVFVGGGAGSRAVINGRELFTKNFDDEVCLDFRDMC